MLNQYDIKNSNKHKQKENFMESYTISTKNEIVLEISKENFFGNNIKNVTVLSNDCYDYKNNINNIFLIVYLHKEACSNFYKQNHYLY